MHSASAEASRLGDHATEIDTEVMQLSVTQALLVCQCLHS